ncbi:serine protease AprX [Anaerospora hongkongensis]|uniref:Serine protease AprX n=1 Tax=Anaerospora hongkongensis TaxID=244830 RepID=A0A4R1PX94_9FIRM|nr:S8 family serine peptidase [Anaerospora hongkongensis]TCL35666.1 serine protease AprX [Anaerospora hongkongensis]
MEYILRVKNSITEDQKKQLSLHGNVIFESKYIPILAVESRFPQKIAEFDFVENIRPSRVGEYQEGDYLSAIVFEPQIKKRLLVNNQLTGWGAKIFILDSGVDGRLVSIQEQKDYTRTGYNDFVGHGTIIAKIIKHFAKGSQIFSAKIGTPKPQETNLIRGIEWAIDQGAHVINISSEYPRKKKCKGKCELCEMVDFAASKGIAVVVAAGNSEQAEDSITCPGIANGSITVGAVDRQGGGIASYSSVGCPGGNKPNLIAPGQGHCDGNPFSGTSFAAPVLTGLIGALLGRTGSVGKAIEYICKTVEDLNLPRHHQGLGCINLDKLLEVLNNEIPNIKSEGQVGN